MGVKILNEAGNWDYWTDELKAELKNAHSNQDVGEELVFENDTMKVWTIHLKPDHRLPFHCHNKKYFWTAMSEGKAKSYYDDGSVKESTYGIGDTQYFDELDEDHFFIHDLTNTGDSVLLFSTVEFKAN